MSSNLIPQPTTIQRICTAYEKSVFLPFIIPFMNAIGLGSIDRIASKHATDYQFKQYNAILRELDKKIDKKLSQPGSDDFYPAVQTSLNALLQTTSTEKAALFATVIAGTWSSQQSNWSEVSQTLRLIRELEDIHIAILHEAKDIHFMPGQPNFTVGDNGYKDAIKIDDKFADIDPMLLLACVSDLISKGLLNDSFTGDGHKDSNIVSLAQRLNMPPKPSKLAYSISPLGLWFLERLASV